MNVNRTKFDDLSDSILLKLFEYFDVYQLYQVFFNLNQRFQQLIRTQAKIFIDLDSFGYNRFLFFCVQLHQIIHSNSPLSISCKENTKTKLSLFLLDDLFVNRFSQLKSLNIQNMDTLAFHSLFFFDGNIKIYETIERLTLSLETSSDVCGYIEGTNITTSFGDFYQTLFSSKMKSLKYLKLIFSPLSVCHECEQELEPNSKLNLRFCLPSTKRTASQLESLIIGGKNEFSTKIMTQCLFSVFAGPTNDSPTSTTRISFGVLTEELLPNLPKLKNLTIDELHFTEDVYRRRSQTNGNVSPNLQLIQFYCQTNENNEKKIKDFFLNKRAPLRPIKFFRINTKNMLK